MCLGCVASDSYWDAASEDQRFESPEQQERERRDALRASLHAGLVHLEDAMAAEEPGAGTRQ